ncbi:type 4a pilus biogenesis protein PilO [Petrachloros mirabilis]
MKHLILQELRKPYGVLIPWAGLASVLLVSLWVVQFFGVENMEQARSRLEGDWALARKVYLHHQEALQAKKDLAQVWEALLEEHDFAALALGITEEAKQKHVTLPALSSKTEATLVPHISKGMLQGTLSGRYEDLRRFLYDIETAEELVYIEDLDLVQSSTPQDLKLAFNIKITTYLRGEPSRQIVQ